MTGTHNLAMVASIDRPPLWAPFLDAFVRPVCPKKTTVALSCDLFDGSPSFQSIGHRPVSRKSQIHHAKSCRRAQLFTRLYPSFSLWYVVENTLQYHFCVGHFSYFVHLSSRPVPKPFFIFPPRSKSFFHKISRNFHQISFKVVSNI